MTLSNVAVGGEHTYILSYNIQGRYHGQYSTFVKQRKANLFLWLQFEVNNWCLYNV